MTDPGQWKPFPSSCRGACKRGSCGAFAGPLRGGRQGRSAFALLVPAPSSDPAPGSSRSDGQAPDGYRACVHSGFRFAVAGCASVVFNTRCARLRKIWKCCVHVRSTLGKGVSAMSGTQNGIHWGTWALHRHGVGHRDFDVTREGEGEDHDGSCGSRLMK